VALRLNADERTFLLRPVVGFHFFVCGAHNPFLSA
jgi:hypothetical protein